MVEIHKCRNFFNVKFAVIFLVYVKGNEITEQKFVWSITLQFYLHNIICLSILLSVKPQTGFEKRLQSEKPPL